MSRRVGSFSQELQRVRRFKQGRKKGRGLSAYTMPPDAQEVRSLRIVVRPHINQSSADQLAEDVIAACDWLKKHGGNATPPVLHVPEDKVGSIA
jgi:glutamate decarboxylase